MRRAMLWLVAGLGGAAALAVGGWAWAVSGVEQPAYAVLEADGAIELRAYPPLTVAEIDRGGDRGAAVRAGFGPLAGYIFARERPGEKIAMTAPVTQRQTGAGRWTVQFVMPAGRSAADLPAPAGAEVRLADWPAARRAAIRFSGVADDALIAREEARLRDWMAARGLEPLGPPLYAYYNDPFTPGFLRRNEVLFEVR